MLANKYIWFSPVVDSTCALESQHINQMQQNILSFLLGLRFEHFMSWKAWKRGIYMVIWLRICDFLNIWLHNFSLRQNCHRLFFSEVIPGILKFPHDPHCWVLTSYVQICGRNMFHSYDLNDPQLPRTFICKWTKSLLFFVKWYDKDF